MVLQLVGSGGARVEEFGVHLTSWRLGCDAGRMLFFMVLIVVLWRSILMWWQP